MRRVTTLTVALACAVSAHAAPPQPLTGTYAFTGKTLVDRPPSERPDTHFVVTLDGAAARPLPEAQRDTAARRVPRRRLDDQARRRRAVHGDREAEGSRLHVRDRPGATQARRWRGLLIAWRVYP